VQISGREHVFPWVSLNPGQGASVGNIAKKEILVAVKSLARLMFLTRRVVAY
jgi:hypothetical protein